MGGASGGALTSLVAPRARGLRDGDPLVLTGILRRTVEARGDTVAGWAQRGLFDRIGVRRLVVEPDPYGNPLLIGALAPT